MATVERAWRVCITAVQVRSFLETMTVMSTGGRGGTVLTVLQAECTLWGVGSGRCDVCTQRA